MNQQKPLLGELPDWTRFPRPVALWPFIKAGNLIDLSGNGKHGTLAAGAFFDAGKYGPAVRFDGSDDYVNIGSFDVPSDFSIVVRIQVPNTWVTYYPQIFASYLAATDRISFRARDFDKGDDVFFIARKNSINNTVQSTSPLSAGSHHLVVTCPGASAAKLFIDGILDNTGAGGSMATYTASDTRIGSYIGVGASWFNGLVDYLVVFDCILSASEIAYLYWNPFPWFVEDEVSHLYVPAPPTVKPFWYYQQMQSVMRRTG